MRKLLAIVLIAGIATLGCKPAGTTKSTTVTQSPKETKSEEKQVEKKPDKSESKPPEKKEP